ncbi:MAG: DNA topoisomerase IV, partial [Actinobacteria bacterium]|nr:DNA topoisomerase IV [Actinomycetota bacterium]
MENTPNQSIETTQVTEQQKLIPDEQNFAKDIVRVTVGEEMRESFLAYSLSVITSRAIPDVRDGLKPVQRRILYAMLRMGIRADTPHRKSARVVGETMGRYHPHGDAAIYDALVRLGQDFARGITFIDPQGNFGSLDDPPAAPRYTECRLTEAAMAMVGEIDEDTVDFRPTYDGESLEPISLPGLIPGLLVNGTTGIAVGMATNMPTHNLAEVAAAIEIVMKKRRPKPTVDELLAVLP